MQKYFLPLFDTIYTSILNYQAVLSPLPLSNAVLLLKMIVGNINKLANFNEGVREGQR